MRFREDKQKWGGLVHRATRMGSKLAPASVIGPTPTLANHAASSKEFVFSLSFMFKADWQGDSDVAATWSIWSLIPASTQHKHQ